MNGYTGHDILSLFTNCLHGAKSRIRQGARIAPNRVERTKLREAALKPLGHLTDEEFDQSMTGPVEHPRWGRDDAIR
jgi:hypothetical protein